MLDPDPNPHFFYLDHNTGLDSRTLQKAKMFPKGGRKIQNLKLFGRLEASYAWTSFIKREIFTVAFLSKNGDFLHTGE
jgi:hypothetical protein